MAETTGKLPLGATPGKLALIGVLAVVFFGVLIFQLGGMFFGSTGARPSPPNGSQPEQPAQDEVVETSAPAAPDEQPRPKWPEVKLDEALAHDPFFVSSSLGALLGPVSEPEAPTAALDEAEQLRAAKLQETLAALRSHGVSMIFDKGQGPMAAIGDQVLEVGDVIGGFRVVDISVEEGVVLEALNEDQNE